MCLLAWGALAHFCLGDACRQTTKGKTLGGVQILYGVGMGNKGPHGDMVTLSYDPEASSVLLCRKRLFVQPSTSVCTQYDTQHVRGQECALCLVEAWDWPSCLMLAEAAAVTDVLLLRDSFWGS